MEPSIRIQSVACHARWNPEIAAPHPPHILQRFLPLLPKYGDLTDQSNFYRLAQDVCELVTVNPVPWEGITIRADEVVAACRQQTLYELFRVIYESAPVRPELLSGYVKA